MLTTLEELEVTGQKAEAIFGHPADAAFILGPYHTVSYGGRFFVWNADDDNFYLLHPGLSEVGDWKLVEHPIKSVSDVEVAIAKFNETLRDRWESRRPDYLPDTE